MELGFSKSYTYFLTPNRKGSIEIGQASIEIDGEVFKTSPKRVEVTEPLVNRIVLNRGKCHC